MGTLTLILLSFVFSLAQPKPFGLELGTSTKEQALSVIKNEGGKVVEEKNRVIKGSIINPEVEGIVVKGLPVKNLKEANFWFYRSRLFKIEYIFPFSKDEFYVQYRHLSQKYGNPQKRIEHTLANGMAEWDFGNVRISLTASRFYKEIHLIYEHLPISRQADESDMFYNKSEHR